MIGLGFSFANPELLFLVIPGVAFVLFFRYTSKVNIPKKILFLRILALLLLVLGLSRPILWNKIRENILVVIQSDNSNNTHLKRVLGTLQNNVENLEIRYLTVKDSIKSTLRKASLLIPLGAKGSIIISREAFEKPLEAEKEAMLLGVKNIPIFVFCDEKKVKDAFPVHFELPGYIVPGVKHKGKLFINTNFKSLLDVLIKIDKKTVLKKKIRVKKEKEACVYFNIPPLPSGIHKIEAYLDSKDEIYKKNNILEMNFAVQKPYKVYWVSGGNKKPWELLSKMTFDVLPLDIKKFSTKIKEDKIPDIIVLDDIPAFNLDKKVLTKIEKIVSSGTGLFVCGAKSSFGPGGYGEEPFSKILPVLPKKIEERRDPSVSLALIIDTSGSMGNRVDIAKEVARLAIRRLKPHDKVGIVEFYGQKRWAAPLQPASNQIDILRALNRLQSGGGTVLLPAIEEAYYGLLNVTTRYKHVLILTDGGVERGPFEALVRKMAENGITVSTVLVGPGRESDFLVNLAMWGRGRYYQAPGRFQLPEIILKQPTTSPVPSVVPGPLNVERTFDIEEIKDILQESIPPIGGVSLTSAKEFSDVILSVSGGLPLVARWRWGVGNVLCFTTEVQGELLGEWKGWKAYPLMLNWMLKECGKRGGYPWLECSAEWEGKKLVVYGRAVNENGFPSMNEKLVLVSEGVTMGEFLPYTLGRYKGEIHVKEKTNKNKLLIARLMKNGKVVAERIVPIPLKNKPKPKYYYKEYAKALIAHNRGKVNPSHKDLVDFYKENRGYRVKPFYFAPYLILLAIFLYLMEVLLRRLPQRRETI